MHTSNVLYLGMRATPPNRGVPSAETSAGTWQNRDMNKGRPQNACHRCGATAYRPVLGRDTLGAMRPTGQYQCVRCRLAFFDLREWRDGTPNE